jgi:preprotein translocase subunit SecG
MLTLGASIVVSLLAMLFALTCLFMMLVILIQKPKGGGLSGAFGGAGGSAQAAFGAKTGDLLTTITIGCFVVFLGLAIGLTYAIRADTQKPVAAQTTPTTTSETSETGGSSGAAPANTSSQAPPAPGAESATDDVAPSVESQPQATPQPTDAGATDTEKPTETPAEAPATDPQPCPDPGATP